MIQLVLEGTTFVSVACILAHFVANLDAPDRFTLIARLVGLMFLAVLFALTIILLKLSN